MARVALAATGALVVVRQAVGAGVEPNKMVAGRMAAVKAVRVRAAEGKALGVKVVVRVEDFGNWD